MTLQLMISARRWNSSQAFVELTGAQRADIVKAQWNFRPQNQSRIPQTREFAGLSQDIMPNEVNALMVAVA